jgi:hypothetical protein
MFGYVRYDLYNQTDFYLFGTICIILTIRTDVRYLGEAAKHHSPPYPPFCELQGAFQCFACFRMIPRKKSLSCTYRHAMLSAPLSPISISMRSLGYWLCLRSDWKGVDNGRRALWSPLLARERDVLLSAPAKLLTNRFLLPISSRQIENWRWADNNPLK